MFIVEDGSGKTDSNSYITTAFAGAYHSSLGNSAWDTYSLPVQEKSCVKATMFIDLSFKLSGVKNTREQGLEFPRTGCLDKNNYIIPDNEVPVEVKKATAECALLFLEQPDLSADNLERIVKRKKVGPLETEYETSQDFDKTFETIKNHMRGIGIFNRYSSNSGMAMRM